MRCLSGRCSVHTCGSRALFPPDLSHTCYPKRDPVEEESLFICYPSAVHSETGHVQVGDDDVFQIGADLSQIIYMSLINIADPAVDPVTDIFENRVADDLFMKLILLCKIKQESSCNLPLVIISIQGIGHFNVSVSNFIDQFI